MAAAARQAERENQRRRKNAIKQLLVAKAASAALCEAFAGIEPRTPAYCGPAWIV